MATDDRDRQFERALARHLSNSSPDSGCPDPETLAAYHERTLSLGEMARWKEHIVSCERCQQTLALVEQSEHVNAEEWDDQRAVIMEEAAAPVALRAATAASPHQEERSLSAGEAVPKVTVIKRAAASRTLRWAAPLGALAAGVIVWVGIHERITSRSRVDESTQVARQQQAPPAPPPASQPAFESGEPQARTSNEETGLKKVSPPARALQSPRAEVTANLPSKDKELDSKESRGEGIGGMISAGNVKTVKPQQSEDANELAKGPAPGAPMPSAGVVGGSGGGIGIQGQKKAPNKIAGESSGDVKSKLQKQDQRLYRDRAGAGKGRLSGQVTDTSGAAVAGTNVRVLGEKGAVVATTEADSSGNYSFSSLPTGRYDLEFQQAGFKTKLIEQLNVSPGENQVNSQLQVGAITETVAVEAAVPTVNSDSATVSPTTAVVSELANRQRDFMLLVQGDRRYIVAPGDRNAWRIGEQGMITRTTNSGKTWKAQKSGVAADLSAGSAPSAKVCWLVGKGGTVLLTADGGRHWKRVASPATEDLGNVLATDALNARVWDAAGQKSFKTSDGGETWVPVNP